MNTDDTAVFKYGDMTIRYVYDDITYFAHIGKVQKVTLGDDDHGSLTGWIFLELDHGHQAAGGYSLGKNDGSPSIRLSQWMWMCAKLLGGFDFDAMKGKYLLALYEDEKTRGSILGLAHPLDCTCVVLFKDIFTDD